MFLPVHGAHQADNAAAAVAAVEAFFGRPLDDDVVAEAFARLRLPGRFEVLHRAPLLVLDGAHNPAGAAAAAATLAGEFTIGGIRRWVLGLLRGRDVDEMLDALGVRPGDQVIATTPPSPRGLPAAELAAAVAARDVQVDVEPEVAGGRAAWRPRRRPGTPVGHGDGSLYGGGGGTPAGVGLVRTTASPPEAATARRRRPGGAPARATGISPVVGAAPTLVPS